jgi:hypothetical protein
LGHTHTREIVHKDQPSPWYTQFNLSWGNGYGGRNYDYVFSRVGFTDGTMSDLFSGSLPQNQWIHAACVWDGTTHYLYINGELVAYNNVGSKTLAYTQPSGNRYHWVLGRDYVGGPGALFRGYIAEVRFYNRATYADDPPFLGGSLVTP